MFKIDITGLDKLQRELEDAQAAFAALDGEIATLKFAPDNQESVEEAIRQMEAAIDDKVGRYHSNALVVATAQKLKQTYSEAIWAKATVARSSKCSLT